MRTTEIVPLLLFLASPELMGEAVALDGILGISGTCVEAQRCFRREKASEGIVVLYKLRLDVSWSRNAQW